MPPVACSGCGREGSQMLFRLPTIPLEPWAHSPTRPPMSPMPGTWQTPPGSWDSWGSWDAAGVRLAVSLSAEAAARVALVVPVAARAGVEIASPATASSSTRINQREMWRPGEEESARSRPEDPGDPAGSDEAGEIAILRELLVLLHDDESVHRVLAADVLTAEWPSPGGGSASALGSLRAAGSGWLRLARVGLVSIQSLSSSETRSIPIRPARSSRSRKMHSPLPSERRTALCSSEGATPSSDMTFATSPRSVE